MSKAHMTTGIAVVAALVVVAIFFIFNNPFAIKSAQPMATEQVNTDGFAVQDEKIGTGEVAQAGSLVTVHYTGKLQSTGAVFDSSIGKNPIQFVLGQGVVIPGWEQGLQGMKVGGKRILIIPPGLGYGAVANGPIPASSTLVFEVELVGVEKSGAVPAR